MTMDLRTFSAHALVLIATGAGILGMGIAFDGAMHGSLVEVSRGLLFLVLGLWWAGRALGRSMLAARRSKDGRTAPSGTCSTSRDEERRHAKPHY